MPHLLLLFFQPLGGWLMDPQAFTNVSLLFYLLSGDRFSLTLGWLHCCLSFSWLRLAIACIHGARSSSGSFDRNPPLKDLVRVDSHLVV